MWKSEKAHFLELQVQQAISHTLYELGTLGLAYLTHYDQYFTILHYPVFYVETAFGEGAGDMQPPNLNCR